jgi:hypothetical protein
MFLSCRAEQRSMRAAHDAADAQARQDRAGATSMNEVKATSKPRLADCAHLRSFGQGYERKTRAGLARLSHSRMAHRDVLVALWWRVL